MAGLSPELASRAHIRTVVPTIRKALEESKYNLHQMDGIAVTAGPGLVGSLLVGISIAKGMALAVKKKLIGVHHLEGHIFSILLEHEKFESPFLTLLVSGGHSEIVFVKTLGHYEVLGRTRDDAAGEAFDKGAKMLGLLSASGSIHGGRLLAESAAEGNPDAIPFPRGLCKEDTLDFSFSGLKTALRNHIGSLSEREKVAILPDIAASFEMAIVDALVAKTVKAMEGCQIKTVALAGGVDGKRDPPQEAEPGSCGSWWNSALPFSYLLHGQRGHDRCCRPISSHEWDPIGLRSRRRSTYEIVNGCRNRRSARHQH